MIAGRTDMRGVNTFTIDGADAKDFDDAISLERVGGRNGHLRVGIHIAGRVVLRGRRGQA